MAEIAHPRRARDWGGDWRSSRGPAIAGWCCARPAKRGCAAMLGEWLLQWVYAQQEAALLPPWVAEVQGARDSAAPRQRRGWQAEPGPMGMLFSSRYSS